MRIAMSSAIAKTLRESDVSKEVMQGKETTENPCTNCNNGCTCGDVSVIVGTWALLDTDLNPKPITCMHAFNIAGVRASTCWPPMKRCSILG